MEEEFQHIAGIAALFVECAVVAMVTIGALFAIYHIIRAALAGAGNVPQIIRQVWLRFAGWILLALEFALGADIIRTAIAPTWDDIGKLGAIAAIRTFLGFFLDRDMKSIESEGREAKEEKSA